MRRSYYAALLSMFAACSDPSPAMDPPDTPDAPDAPTFTLEIDEVRPTEVALRWSPEDGATAYWLAYQRGGDAPATCAQPQRIAKTDETTVVVSGLDARTSYAFRLCPVRDQAGALTIDPGATATATTLALPPGEPSNLRLVQSGGALVATWDAADGASAYVVAYAEGMQAPATCFGGSVLHTTTTSAQLMGLATNRTWTVRVCAKNDNPMPDLSAGTTGVAFLHSPAAPDPATISSASLDAEWAKLTWTAAGSDYRVAVAQASTPTVGCTTATTTTTRASLVLTNLAPAQSYTVRVCTSNGDTQPLWSDGRTFTFTTPARVEPRVNGLTCLNPTDPYAIWSGTGPLSSYAYTMADASIAASAPLCANTAGTGNVQGLGSVTATGFRMTLGGQLGASYWIRVCYRLTGGGFDQGQEFRIRMPFVSGSVLIPATCTEAERIERPTLTMAATSAVAHDVVQLSGTCSLPGSQVRLGGDVAATTVYCGTDQRWTASAQVTALGDGPIRIAAVAWNGTRFQGPAAFVQVTKQCIASGTACGDGILDAGEECDLGCGNGDDRACTPACKLAVCGDGLVGPSEECDLGAQNSNAGSCMANCQLQRCGNGIVGGGEQCDLGALNSPSAACTPECRTQVCGDGYVGANEACDLGVGNHAVTSTCTPTCQVQTCGDGFRGAGEECDAGAANATTGACLPGCVLARCGDGYVSPLEGCDDGNTLDGDSCPASCNAHSPTGRLSVGSAHACGLLASGSVSCWGYADYSKNPPPGPLSLVSAGITFTCGLGGNGTAACWGEHLGVPQGPTPPAGAFVHLDAGYGNVCGVRSDGTLACWGRINSYGEATPPLGTFTQVSVGTYAACGVRSSGSVDCWGTAIDPPANAGTFTRVSVSSSQPCGLRTDGSFACWGASGIYLDRPGPYVAVASGSNHTCALTAGGMVECVGSNTYGQSTPPVGTFVALDGERDSTCAIRADGNVVCWGRYLTNPTGDFLP